MRLYHGSDIVVDKPMILRPNRRMDFGSGFYTTESEQQAIDWAIKMRDRHESDQAFISVYDYDENNALKVLSFDEATEDWFDFVHSNRFGVVEHDYDVVIGPIADDGVIQTLFRYEDGLITKDQAIVELKTFKFDGQVLFHTDKSLMKLTYVGYMEVG